MASRIHQIVPDPEVFLGLEPEDLGAIVREHLNSLTEAERESLNCYNLSLPGSGVAARYPPAYDERIRRVIMEGWMWLEREGLIVPKPGQSGDWVFITRRGQKMKSRTDLEAYRRADLLLRQLLHPLLAAKVVPMLTRGNYETAVFQAFKEVEVAVRVKAKLPASDLGTKLVRKVFNGTNGLLRDLSVVAAEQEARAHLFAGAVGSFKNPQRHRHVPINEPAEAVELLFMASHLLRIADALPQIP